MTKKQKQKQKQYKLPPKLDLNTVSYLLDAVRAEADRLEKAAKAAAREGGPMLHHAAEQWTRSTQCEAVAVLLGQLTEAALIAHGVDSDLYAEFS